MHHAYRLDGVALVIAQAGFDRFRVGARAPVAGDEQLRRREHDGHGESLPLGRRRALARGPPVSRIPLRGRHPGIDRRHLDVLERGGGADQVVALENDADPLTHWLRVQTRLGNVRAIQPDRGRRQRSK